METQLWLRANIVPRTGEVDNPDGSKKTKVRPIALLETRLELIESVAMDQHADHIDALMQEQQVGFRVREGAEAMISAVRVLVQGDTSNAHGSINRLAVLKAVRKHIPCLAQLVRDGTDAVMKERDGNGKKSELHHSVAKGVWQGSTLSNATFCLTFWQELLGRPNSIRHVLGFISFADDCTVSCDDDEADRLWDGNTRGPKGNCP